MPTTIPITAPADMPLLCLRAVFGVTPAELEIEGKALVVVSDDVDETSNVKAVVDGGRLVVEEDVVESNVEIGVEAVVREMAVLLEELLDFVVDVDFEVDDFAVTVLTTVMVIGPVNVTPPITTVESSSSRCRR